MKFKTNLKLLVSLCFLLQIKIYGQNFKVNQNWWQPNGEVKTIISDSTTVYVGGSFSSVSPNIRYGCQFDTTSNIPDLNFNYKTNPNGSVFSSIEDGNGGWIIGGSFSKIGDFNRMNLAWINSDGSLKNWSPKVDGLVRALEIKNGVLYIGGAFKYVDGKPRYSLASFDMITGNLTSWQPSTNATVTSMEADSNNLYIGGNFTHTAESKNRFDLTFSLNNLSSPFYSRITPNGKVLCSVSDGQGGWFIGGEFTKIGNVERKFLARINSDGTLSSWNPRVDSTVQFMATLNNDLYLSGKFVYVGDSVRDFGTCVISFSGNLKTTDFQVKILSSALIGLYTSGNFIYAYGNQGWGVRRFNASGQMDQWQPYLATVESWNMNGTPNRTRGTAYAAVVEIDTFVILSGDFNWVNGNTSLGNCAVFSSINGRCLTMYNLVTNGKITSFAHESSSLFALGDFSSIGGVAKTKIAKINISDFSIDNLDLNLNGLPYKSVIWNHKLYVTGNFDSVLFVGSGMPSDGIVQIDADDGTVTNFSSQVQLSGRYIETLSFYNAQMYIGGDLITGLRNFTQSVGSCKLNNSIPNAFRSKLNGVVYCLKVNGNELLMGGNFTQNGDSVSMRLGSVLKSNGVPSRSYPQLINSGTVYSIVKLNNSLFIGGSFLGFNNEVGLAKMDLTSRKLVNTEQYYAWVGASLKVHNNILYLAGYRGEDTYKAYGLFKINTTTLDRIWQNQTNTWVRTVSFNKSKLYIGGDFTSVSIQNRNNAFALDAKTGQIKSWNPNVDGLVSALILKDNNVYIGGTFNNVGGQVRTNLASVDKTSGAPVAWRPSPNSSVIALASSNDTLYVGGTFTNIGGADRSYIAALDLTTSYALDWNPSPNGVVRSIIAKGDKIYLGGEFNNIAGQDRSYLAKFKTDGSLMSWNPKAYKYRFVGGWVGYIRYTDGGIFDMKLSGNNLYVGGDLNMFNLPVANSNIQNIGDIRVGVAQIDANTGSATSWNAQLSTGSVVNALLLRDSFLIAGGNLNMANEPMRPFLTSVYTSTANVGNWTSNIDNVVSALYLNGNDILVGGKFLNVNSKKINYLAAFQAPYPVITSFYPSVAFTNDTVAIYGENFTGATKVTFGDVMAKSFTIISDNEILAIVDAGASGQIKVETPIGIASKGLFTFKNVNKLTSISASNISLYPNPANTILNVRLYSNLIPVAYSIYSIYGLKIKNGVLENTNNNIDIESLPIGMYIFTTEGEKSVSLKFIKQ